MTLEELEKEFNEFKAKVKNEFGEMKKDFDAQGTRLQKIEKQLPDSVPVKEGKKDDSWW